MSSGRGRPFESALDLARAFDAAFAEAPQADRESFEGFLALRIAEDAYAVNVAQVAALLRDRRVTPLPSPLSGLLGVAGVRGSIVPIYDMRVLLGYPPRAGSSWLVLAAAPQPVGFAFDLFEGQFRVPRAEATSTHTASSKHAGQAVRLGATVRKIVDLASLVDIVRERLVALRTRAGT